MSDLASSMILAVLGIVFYHLAQKLQPSDLSMFWLLAIAYLVAGIVCILICLFIPSMHPVTFTIPPASLLLALAMITIEFGYLWAYRVGWKISLAGLVGTTAATMILLPIGIAIFREKFAASNFIGLLLCTIGLLLTAKH
ncbi:MAG: hypothetical protein QNJ53_29195 [Pleurocapsa sp. MO_192.B19]|nr:hypothetical protein [Pleurocapsa sp. MO_192.B19]